jgi:hypothetical protein
MIARIAPRLKTAFDKPSMKTILFQKFEENFGLMSRVREIEPNTPFNKR